MTANNPTAPPEVSAWTAFEVRRAVTDRSDTAYRSASLVDSTNPSVAVRTGSCSLRPMRATRIADTTKVAALTTKAASREKTAEKRPPSAAPRASIAPQAEDISTLAGASSSSETTFGNAPPDAG